MSTIQPFKGWRPKPEFAAKVAAKPYDVLSSEEARREAAGNPYSFYHVTKAEIDLPPDTDVHSNEVYQKANENFQQFINDGFFIRDKEDSLYIYRIVMDGRTQTGIVACSGVEDYFNEVIKKHEHTRPVKERDRINHIKATGIHPGPVFLTYPDVKEINRKTEEITGSKKPVYDFKADDGIQHTLWLVSDNNDVREIVTLFMEKAPFTYIADGHHRAASSAKVAQEMAEKNPKHTGKESYNFFLSVLFPASQVRIMDYNRVVKDLNGMTAPQFMQRLEEKFEALEYGKNPYKPVRLHEFGIYLNGEWYRLKAKKGTYDDNDPIEGLDVTVLQNHVLEPLLGIKDPRTDERIDFVGGIRGLKELEKRVDSGEMSVAFALYPVTIEQLIKISDAGQVMPPKSTWFEPKLRSGLVVHQIK